MNKPLLAFLAGASFGVLFVVAFQNQAYDKTVDGNVSKNLFTENRESYSSPYKAADFTTKPHNSCMQLDTLDRSVAQPALRAESTDSGADPKFDKTSFIDQLSRYDGVLDNSAEFTQLLQVLHSSDDAVSEVLLLMSSAQDETERLNLADLIAGVESPLIENYSLSIATNANDDNLIETASLLSMIGSFDANRILQEKLVDATFYASSDEEMYSLVNAIGELGISDDESTARLGEILESNGSSDIKAASLHSLSSRTTSENQEQMRDIARKYLDSTEIGLKSGALAVLFQVESHLLSNDLKDKVSDISIDEGIPIDIRSLALSALSEWN